MIRSTERTQVAVRRVGTVGGAEGLGALVFVGQIGCTRRPSAADNVGGLHVLGAALRRGGPHPAFMAIEAAAHDDVYNAGDSVRAIQGRCPVEQNIHPLHGSRRQGGDVGELRAGSRPGQPPAVDQNEGRRRSQAAQVDACRKDIVRPAGVGQGGLADRCRRAGVVLRQGDEGLRHGARSPAIEIITAERDQWRGELSRRSQQGACDDHVLQRRDRLPGRLRARRATSQIDDAWPGLGPHQA